MSEFNLSIFAHHLSCPLFNKYLKLVFLTTGTIKPLSYLLLLSK